MTASALAESPMPTPPNPSERALRVMIAGGGTGGHLFPGVALAETVVAHGGTVRFVGTERGIEARALAPEGWELDTLEVQGIKGRGLRGLFAGLSALPRAYLQSRRILRDFGPDVVVGVGGYASGPVVATAATLGIPTAILEQNSMPGITNRILGRLVRRIYTTFPDRAGRFPARKVEQAGNPIRGALLERLQGAERSRTRAVHAPRLFVFGGSQGARALNEGMMGAVAGLLEAVPDLEIWHQTGKADADRVRDAYAAAGLEGPRARVDPFIRDMSGPYGWCDLVLCRAGATSLAELAAVGAPAVLVPFPFATDNHQEHNAADLVERGAAVMVRQADLDETRLIATLAQLLGDPARLRAMGDHMLAAARPEAAQTIYAGLCGLV